MLRNKTTKLTACFCLALLAAACEGDPNRSPDAQAIADNINIVFHNGKWKQIPATPTLHAETIIFEQRVAFDDATPRLDRDGHRAIDQLLKEARPQPGSLVSLSIGGSAQGASAIDRVTLQRLEAVRIALADRGYASELATSQVARVAALNEGEIGLTLTKVMPILPDCDQPQPREPHPPSFNDGYGCSTANNLSVMVANPSDLVRGRDLEPADAEAMSLSIQRYRVGEPEPLTEEDTKSE
jgi:pilus assembly protein CpaD